MIIVSNTSPIINLTIVGQLNLLEQLYGNVIIPQAVYDEIMIEGHGQPGADEIDRLDWIEIRSISNRSLVAAFEWSVKSDRCLNNYREEVERRGERGAWEEGLGIGLT
jgi:predicted nucleic acid-binding protein